MTIDTSDNTGFNSSPTPVHRVSFNDGRAVFFKDETKQESGAFKIRGVRNRLRRSTTAGVVVTASTGNHGAACALASKDMNRPCHVFVPASTPTRKTSRIEEAGAVLHKVLGDYAACDEHARAFAELHGGEYIPSFDDIDIIEGHTSLFTELLEVTGPLKVLYVPVGGGGLISAAALTFRDTSTTVVGVELKDAASMKQSLARGERTAVEVPDGIAEGLCVRTIGHIPFQILREHPVEIVEVTVADLAAACRFLDENCGIRPELAGAAATAGMMVAPRGTGVTACVVSGGNIDAATWNEQVLGSPRPHATYRSNRILGQKARSRSSLSRKRLAW